jgi:hypothetical protein
MLEAKLDGIYVPSEDIVAREIEGQILIVPLTAGIGNLEDELYSFSETGKAIWQRLDGKASLRAIVQALSDQYEAEPGEIEQDALDLVTELLARRIVVESPRG